MTPYKPMRKKYHSRRPSNRLPALLFISMILALFLQAPAPLPAITRSAASGLASTATIQSVIDAVSQDGLTSLVSDLSGVSTPLIGAQPFQFQTRSTSAAIPIEKATQYAYETFAALGLDVHYQTWVFRTTQVRNVIAVQPGSAAGRCVYIAMAHLDSTAYVDPQTLAPGADDNASGAAAVLMLAQTLSPEQFACTIRYILVTGEEQGLLGSEAYVNTVSSDPILGAFVLDMIAYNSDTQPIVELTTRTNANGGSADQPLSAAVKTAINNYAIALQPEDAPDNSAVSDHASFWQAGFPAIMVIEDWQDFNPFYHNASDTLDKLNMVYYTNIVKAVAGALADLASQERQPYHSYLPGVMR